MGIDFLAHDDHGRGQVKKKTTGKEEIHYYIPQTEKKFVPVALQTKKESQKPKKVAGELWKRLRQKLLNGSQSSSVTKKISDSVAIHPIQQPAIRQKPVGTSVQASIINRPVKVKKPQNMTLHMPTVQNMNTNGMDVNFANEDVFRSSQAQSGKKSFCILASIILSVTAIVVLHFFISAQARELMDQTSLLQDQSNSLISQIQVASRGIEAMSLTQKDLTVVSNIIMRHAYPTNILKFFEINTVSDVIYTAYEMNENGEVRVSVLAPRYALITQQLEVFDGQKDIVQSVEVLKAAYSSEKKKTGESVIQQITFEMFITFTPEFLTNIDY
jgi:hypothetical protein